MTLECFYKCLGVPHVGGGKMKFSTRQVGSRALNSALGYFRKEKCERQRERETERKLLFLEFCKLEDITKEAAGRQVPFHPWLSKPCSGVWILIQAMAAP